MKKRAKLVQELRKVERELASLNEKKIEGELSISRKPSPPVVLSRSCTISADIARNIITYAWRVEDHLSWVLTCKGFRDIIRGAPFLASIFPRVSNIPSSDMLVRFIYYFDKIPPNLKVSTPKDSIVRRITCGPISHYAIIAVLLEGMSVPGYKRLYEPILHIIPPNTLARVILQRDILKLVNTSLVFGRKEVVWSIFASYSSKHLWDAPFLLATTPCPQPLLNAAMDGAEEFINNLHLDPITSGLVWNNLLQLLSGCKTFKDKLRVVNIIYRCRNIQYCCPIASCDCPKPLEQSSVGVWSLRSILEVLPIEEDIVTCLLLLCMLYSHGIRTDACNPKCAWFSAYLDNHLQRLDGKAIQEFHTFNVTNDFLHKREDIITDYIMRYIYIKFTPEELKGVCPTARTVQAVQHCKTFDGILELLRGKYNRYDEPLDKVLDAVEAHPTWKDASKEQRVCYVRLRLMNLHMRNTAHLEDIIQTHQLVLPLTQMVQICTRATSKMYHELQSIIGLFIDNPEHFEGVIGLVPCLNTKAGREMITRAIMETTQKREDISIFEPIYNTLLTQALVYLSTCSNNSPRASMALLLISKMLNTKKISLPSNTGNSCEHCISELKKLA